MGTAVDGLRAGAPQIALVQGVLDGPPPPLAGALAAWVLRAGGAVRVLDRRGEAREAHEGWPLWVHVEGGVEGGVESDVESDVAAALAWAVGATAPTFFGPGVEGEGGARLRVARPEARIVRGDPEPALGGGDERAPHRDPAGTRADLLDPASLPLTTFAGFGAQPGGWFRLLAGRGGRARPVAAVVREVVYLVETHALGHIRFDDADLAALVVPGGGAFLAGFEAELAHLPWRVTWEGRAGGALVRGGRRAPA